MLLPPHARVVFQMKLPHITFFDCDRYAAPRDTLLTSAALLLGARWTNATNKTRLKWFLNGMSPTFPSKLMLGCFRVFKM